MKPYIYSILFLLIIQKSYAQSRELILKKSYISDENTVLDLDLDNATIVFEISNDSKIHFDYFIDFSKDSEESQYKIFKGINANSSKTQNIVKLNVKNSMYLGELYSIDVDLETYKQHIKDMFIKKKKNEFLFKSKDSILEEITFSLGSDTNDYFKKLKLKNPDKNYGKSARKFKQHFIIKVPRNIKIKIKALHSKINFNYDVYAPLIISSFQTYYKFNKINNNANVFKLMNGLFQAREISGGNYEIKDIYKVRIGSISNAKFLTETSRIQVGEIKSNVSFSDFDSKVHLYNYGENFTKFNLKGDYTELNFYKVKDTNFSMDVFGLNTTLNLNGAKTTFGTSKEKGMTKILQKKRKENIPFLGNIEVELKNGVLNIK